MNPNMPPTDGDFDINSGADALPSEPMPAGPSMNPNEDCVSLQALAMPDEGERLETPKIGDRVTYQTEGTISRIEGDKAYVTKEAVNGQAVEPDADDMGGPSDGDADNIDKLTADAQTMSTGDEA